MPTSAVLGIELDGKKYARIVWENGYPWNLGCTLVDYYGSHYRVRSLTTLGNLVTLGNKLNDYIEAEKRGTAPIIDPTTLKTLTEDKYFSFFYYFKEDTWYFVSEDLELIPLNVVTRPYLVVVSAPSKKQHNYWFKSFEEASTFVDSISQQKEYTIAMYNLSHCYVNGEVTEVALMKHWDN